jgi:fucose 4-O-acetylase-like acetyltransferase
MPRPQMEEIFRVDILNTMALSMAFFALAAAFNWDGRLKFALVSAVAIAAVSPIVGSWSWHGVPQIVIEYLAPGANRGRFPFFPTASYVGFGLIAGMVVKHASDRVERLMQWSALGGLALLITAQYFSNIPFSIYGDMSDFWRNSPSLIFIRVGISLALLASAYVWTEYAAGPGWSWMQTLGKNSLLVYWVHIMLVYGNIAKRFKRTMSAPEAAIAVIVVTAAMVGLSLAWMEFKSRRQAKRSAAKPAPDTEYATRTLATRTD